ncbi:ThiF family adenylyltransferase, partial [Thiolapillus sp.]
QPEELIATLKEKARHTRSKEAWIVCHTQYQTRDIWFGIKAESHKKCQIPVCGDYLEPWKISAIEVDIHSKSRLLPRAGASTDLQDKKILLVGCGSVGSNIAEQLISAGIGGLHLVDSDSFQSENLYRHTLDMKYLGVNKASALADKLMNEYPYTKITHSPKQLISLDVEELTQADLITIAIGNPTAERALNEILIKEKINTP